jgi:hypothetical protein
MTRRVRALIGISCLVGLSATTACAGPLAVTAITAKDSRVRFGYQQIGTVNTGIITCAAGASGDLEQCQHQRITFIEQGKRRDER